MGSGVEVRYAKRLTFRYVYVVTAVGFLCETLDVVLRIYAYKVTMRTRQDFGPRSNTHPVVLILILFFASSFSLRLFTLLIHFIALFI